MKIITIPGNLVGKSLYDFLIKNKSDLIKQKSAFPIKSEPRDLPVDLSVIKKTNTIKSDPVQVQEVEPGEVYVTAVANTAYWCDSQMDVLIADCWKKTIKEAGPDGSDKVYHLKNHDQSTDGVIGYAQKLYAKEFLLTELGLNMVGMTQSLVLESLVKEYLDESCFHQYNDKKIKQHSIGMQYIKLDLCINDSNNPTEFANWNKYYSLVINKSKIDSVGYFWAVTEIKLFEVSAVLFGSNEITPTLDTEQKDNEPDIDSTHKKEEPGDSTPIKSGNKSFYLNLLTHV